MNLIKLNLREDFELFCPVTGKQMIYAEAPFKPSPATVFCFVEKVGGFEYASEWTKEVFNPKADADGVFFMDASVFLKIISQLLRDEETNNLVCFSITTRGYSCGLVQNTVHFCIDMDY